MLKHLKSAELRMPIVFILVVIILAIASKGVFLRSNNIINLFAQNSIIGVIAIAQFLVILTGGIDLSVGAMVAFTSLAYVMFQNMGLLFCMTLAIAAGCVMGLINGILVTKLRIIPFMATLITMGIFRGLAYIIVNGRVQYNIEPIFLSLNGIRGWSVPLLVYIWLFLAVVWIIVMKYTRFGVTMYSTGGNEKASRLSGLNTGKIKILAYMFSGILCGVAGILYTGRLALADPGLGDSFGMDSITAVVIGGAALSGGKGKLANAVFGVLIFGMLNNFMNIVGIPSAMHVGIKGLILVLTVYLNNVDIFERIKRKRGIVRTLNSGSA